jgi:hypothetical protein
MAEIQRQVQDAMKELLKENDVQRSKQLSGIFVYGVFTGVVLSYSGLLGFGTGIGAGMFIRYQHPQMSGAVLDTVMKRCTDSWSQVKKNM